MQFDFLDTFPKFTDLRLPRIVEERILCWSVVHIDLAEERAFGIVEVAAFRLDGSPCLAGIFLLPFGDNVVVGFHFEKAFENERKALRGRFF